MHNCPHVSLKFSLARKSVISKQMHNKWHRLDRCQGCICKDTARIKLHNTNKKYCHSAGGNS